MALIYVCKNKYEADLSVYEEKNKHHADMIYFVAKNQYQAENLEVFILPIQFSNS